jgi:hypothetical protein
VAAPHQAAAPNAVHYRLELRAIAALAGGQHDRQRPLATLDRQVQLAGQPTPRASQGVVVGLDVDSAWFFALPLPPFARAGGVLMGNAPVRSASGSHR